VYPGLNPSIITDTSGLSTIKRKIFKVVILEGRHAYFKIITLLEMSPDLTCPDPSILLTRGKSIQKFDIFR